MELALVALGFILLSAVVLCSVTIFSPQHSATVQWQWQLAKKQSKTDPIRLVKGGRLMTGMDVAHVCPIGCLISFKNISHEPVGGRSVCFPPINSNHFKRCNQFMGPNAAAHTSVCMLGYMCACLACNSKI